MDATRLLRSDDFMAYFHESRNEGAYSFKSVIMQQKEPLYQFWLAHTRSERDIARLKLNVAYFIHFRCNLVERQRSLTKHSQRPGYYP